MTTNRLIAELIDKMDAYRERRTIGRLAGFIFNSRPRFADMSGFIHEGGELGYSLNYSSGSVLPILHNNA